MLLELELTEPQLYFGLVAEAAGRFAAAVGRAISATRLAVA